ncbi:MULTISPECIES: hypothetical protein [Lysobacter]|uniref:hypothetical protein n=1 Tax=Lysobacter TaxID=68 RepID=UPI001F3EF6CB|nr:MULTISPECIES: hypothetical protein [Lysobacter]UJB19132.1 hypothetical protein L1A79_22935 [Lysobacter capsici]UJQ27143.1 hypothetical protein L2D09_16950 [Lysobacter gummosus]
MRFIVVLAAVLTATFAFSTPSFAREQSSQVCGPPFTGPPFCVPDYVQIPTSTLSGSSSKSGTTTTTTSSPRPAPKSAPAKK